MTVKGGWRAQTAQEPVKPLTAEQQAKLNQAAALVEEVVATFDLTARNCGECNRPHFNNWQAARDADVLNGVVRKIQRISNPRRWVRDGEEQA